VAASAGHACCASNGNPAVQGFPKQLRAIRAAALLQTNRPPHVQTPVPLQALNELEYPEKLQKLLLTPNREMGVELVVQVRVCVRLCTHVLCALRCIGVLAQHTTPRGQWVAWVCRQECLSVGQCSAVSACAASRPRPTHTDDRPHPHAHPHAHAHGWTDGQWRD
jgi:hypothetical protein